MRVRMVSPSNAPPHEGHPQAEELSTWPGAHRDNSLILEDSRAGRHRAMVSPELLATGATSPDWLFVHTLGDRPTHGLEGAMGRSETVRGRQEEEGEESREVSPVENGTRRHMGDMCAAGQEEGSQHWALDHDKQWHQPEGFQVSMACLLAAQGTLGGAFMV